MRAMVFPGQGSQVVGMGKALYDSFRVARDVFQEIDETLSQNLSSLMFQGPFEDLTQTENTQPALMAVSLAVVEVLKKEGNLDLTQHISYAAGHSLGEYSALASFGTLTLSQTALLLKKRGQAMQQAVPKSQGGMVVLLGADVDQAEQVILKAAQGQICEIANDNAPGQIVISGHQTALERALEYAKDFNIKRAMMLPVSAPFHCSLMLPAAQEMTQSFADSDFKAPQVPVISNVTARPETAPAVLQDLLVQQITHRVRWRESILHLKELGITHSVEVGAGKVLTGLSKRIDPDIEAISLSEPADIEFFLKTI